VLAADDGGVEAQLKGLRNGRVACIGIGRRFRFYNESRPHQALGYRISAATGRLK